MEWDETIWCGKIGYQGETTNHPNVDWVQPILDRFFALDISAAKKRIEPDWDACNDDSAKALNEQPWAGGMPPFEWVGEQLAPQFGYHYGDDHLPVFEYYGYYKPDKNAHEFRYLYVPVEKT